MENPRHRETPAAGPDATSASLLLRISARDNVAWQRLVDLYSPLVLSWCRRHGLCWDDSSDVLQEVFAAVAANIAGFRHERPGDTFRGWLRVIARNKIREHRRKQGNQPQAAGGTAAQVRMEDLPDEEMQELDASSDQADRSQLFHRGLELIRGEFEDRTWQAFWLVTVENRPAAEVGDLLQMSPEAVRQAKFRVLRRLRREMGELLE